MQRIQGLFSLLVYFCLVFFFKDRANFWLCFCGLGILFAFYFHASYKAKLDSGATFFWALAFRLVFIISLPILSDDVYRFIWDGHLTISGTNPYLYLPSAFDGEMPFGLLEKLNSPDYYSLYPPLKQYFFVACSWLSGSSILGNVIAIRILLILAALANTYFIKKISLLRGSSDAEANKLSALYALNPFIILETIGNLHFEGLMLCFLLAAYYAYKKTQKVYGSAVLFGMAVSIKLLPLLFLPLLWRKLRFKKGLVFVGIVGLINLLFFLPFYETQLITNVFDSLNLYFHKFEFNASLYYLIREIGFVIIGFNIIQYAGTGLAIVSLLSILWFSFRTKNWTISSLFILSVYFLCSTTIHPWYIITLFGISLFTPYRYPLVWTVLISLSYFAYGQNPVAENLYLVALEYTIVFAVAYLELRQKKPLF